MAFQHDYPAYATFTVEELYAPNMPERFVELLEGEYVEMSPAGHRHNCISGEIELVFRLWAKAHPGLGVGGQNDGFLIMRNPDTLLCPDVALFRKRPQPPEQPWLEFAPEIWVEVLSPSNSPSEMTHKRHRLFDAGTEQFWMLDPAARQLDIHYRDGRRATYAPGQELPLEGIAEGLQLRIEEIFSEA